MEEIKRKEIFKNIELLHELLSTGVIEICNETTVTTPKVSHDAKTFSAIVGNRLRPLVFKFDEENIKKRSQFVL